MSGKLTLVVPGLLGPVPGAAARDLVPPAPALERVLGRARCLRAPAAPYEALAFALFETPVPDDGDLPVAPVSYTGDTGQVPQGWWLRADPVHLRADQQRLVLIGGPALAMDAEEAASLVAGLNALELVPGWRFEAPAADRWYLRLPAAPGVRTHPLSEVLARSIDPYLPYGARAHDWHRLINELQMWLHEQPVNQSRAERGWPTINSLWLWGAGVMPVRARSRWRRVMTSEPLAAGLARLAGQGPEPLPADPEPALAAAGEGADVLCVLDAAREPVLYGDPRAWAEAVVRLEQAWLAPALRALGVGRVAEIELYPADPDRRAYRLRRSDLRRFWRRARPLARALGDRDGAVEATP